MHPVDDVPCVPRDSLPRKHPSCCNHGSILPRIPGVFSVFHIAFAHWSELDASCNSESRVDFPMENILEMEMGYYCHLYMIYFIPLLYMLA